MSDTLSVLVRADAGHGTIELVVEGFLTDRTAPVLLKHLSRACELDPAAEVLIDLSRLRDADEGAVAMVRSAVATSIRHGDAACATVRLLEPDGTFSLAGHAPSAEEVRS